MTGRFKILMLALFLAGFFAFTQEKAPALEDGVTVTGHWTIEVRNPDGTLVERQEFHNSLVSPGLITSRFLAFTPSVHGGMIVALDDGQGGGPCSGECDLVENGLVVSPIHSSNLVVTGTGTSFETITLSGSVTATSTANISRVFTATKDCGDIKPSDCKVLASGYSINTFTLKTLTQTISVQAGQIVQVTVNITFS